MRQHGLFAAAVILAGSSLCLLPKCEALESDCDSLPRIISPFGAENNPGPPIALAVDIRAQLPGLREARRVINTNLAPSGEQIVIYDTNADDSDPHPKVGFVVGGRVVKVFNEIDIAPHGGGFERYLSSCEIELTRSQKAFAIALSSGFDGATTAFAIIRWHSGQYRVVFNPIVGQGRMEFGTLRLELWSAIAGKVRDPKSEDSGIYECVWCAHRYLITKYLWQNGSYVKTDSKRTAITYDPAEISGTPRLAKAQGGKGG